MAKVARKPQPKKKEAFSAYSLKIALYLILGFQWLRIIPQDNLQIPIPIGLFIGLIFASHEHFAIDKKIEIAILFATTIITLWMPVGWELVLKG